MENIEPNTKNLNDYKGSFNVCAALAAHLRHVHSDLGHPVHRLVIVVAHPSASVPPSSQVALMVLWKSLIFLDSHMVPVSGAHVSASLAGYGHDLGRQPSSRRHALERNRNIFDFVGVQLGSSWSCSHCSSMGLKRACSLLELSSLALLTHLLFPSLYCKLARITSLG
jgi:hypothetical protein